ncbi:MAG: glutaminyl-peptide cyclotransferase [Hydrogenophaga sp.]|nr:glutaminyl-peptide cyclotransferase [Hydrogenophaga sp.]
MRGWPAVLFLLLLTPAAAAAQTAAPPAATPVPVYGFEVVRTYPHDRRAFTQGLTFHDGELLESTGRYPSTVRRVRLEDGVVLQSRELDDVYFGEGLTEIDGRVVTLTWTSGKAFVWDADDLTLIAEHAYAGEGWGLTDDGARLILSDGTPTLRFLDPLTLTETGRVAVTLDGRPVSRINELEWIEGEVFANVWHTDLILRIDPATGVVTGVVDLTALCRTAAALTRPMRS